MSIDSFTVGAAFSVLVGASLLVAREANREASEIVKRARSLLDRKAELIDAEVLSCAQQLGSRRRKKSVDLSSEERDRFFLPAIACVNLEQLEKTISAIKDRTSNAYLFGLASAVLSLAAGFGYQSQELAGFAPVFLVVCGLLFVYYIHAGVYVFRPVRQAEITISGLENVMALDQLNDQVTSYLEDVNIAYVRWPRGGKLRSQ